MSALDPGTLEGRMARIGDRLAAEKHGPIDWSRQGCIEAGRSAIFEITRERRERVVLVALSDSRDVDLDIEVRSHSGGTIAVDTAPDIRAAVEWIARPRLTYDVELKTKAKEGRFMIQAFSAPSSTSPAALSKLFDADPWERRSWATVLFRMERLGFGPLEEPTVLNTSRGDRHLFSMSLEQGRCYMIAAQGSPGIDSLDLRVMKKHRLLVADLLGRPEAWVRHCAEKDEEVRVALGVTAGSGTVSVGTFAAQRQDVEQLVGPPLRLEDVPPTLEEMTRSITHRLERNGFLRVEKLFEKEMAAGDRVHNEISLGSGQCAAIHCVGDPGLIDLDLELFDEKGEIVAADRGSGSNPWVRICAEQSGTYRVELIALTGQGRGRVLIAQLPGASLPLLPDPATTFNARQAAARFATVGLKPQDTVKELERRDPDTFGASVSLKGDRCYGFATIGSALIARVLVLDTQGSKTASWKGLEHSALITICPEVDVQREIEVHLKPGSGGEARPYLLIFGSETPSGASSEISNI